MMPGRRTDWAFAGGGPADRMGGALAGLLRPLSLQSGRNTVPPGVATPVVIAPAGYPRQEDDAPWRRTLIND